MRAWPHVVTLTPVPFPYTSARVVACARVFSMCVWVCNAKGQLNLLPLIGGILQPREKTHPISCDMAVTSCRPVFMDAVPVTLLISWCGCVCVCVCEIDIDSS